mgnify:CR=1 FL=1
MDESPSFCSDLRDSLEPDVHKQHCIMKDRMCFSRFSWDTWRFCAIEYFKDKRLIQLLCILGLLVVSIFLKADYGWRGYIFSPDHVLYAKR